MTEPATTGPGAHGAVRDRAMPSPESRAAQPRVLLVDNYDSFTFNLVQYLREVGATVEVRRNDQVEAADLARSGATHLVISPGPGRPSDAGRSKDLIEAALGRIPVLGVCLGHQAIAELLGCPVVHAERLMHGKTSTVYHQGDDIFRGLPNPLQVGRYHSLAVRIPEDHPDLRVTAHTEDGEVMAIRHEFAAVHGVQFHPESVLTPDGRHLLANFLGRAP